MSQSTPIAHSLRHRWGLPRFGYYSYHAALALGARIRPLAYCVDWLVALYFLLCVPRARRGSMKYLDLLYSPKRRSLLQRYWHTYQHLIHFGYLLLDRALMLAKPRHGYRIECQGLANFPKSFADHAQGVILLSAHFGNAEVGIPYLPQMGFDRPIHIVMYHDPHDAHERVHMRHQLLLADMPIISTTDPLAAGLSIMAALKKGDTVAMRADRILAGKGIPVMLLGQRVCLPAGPFLAAVLSGVPVLYIYTCRLSYRRYACRFSAAHRYQETPDTPREALLARAAQDYAIHLESLLKEFPFQWSNFYDYWTEQRPT